MDRAKRERDEGTTAKCPEAAVEDNEGRKKERESRISVINNTSATAPPLRPGLDWSIARRMTEERWRERRKERTLEEDRVGMNAEERRRRVVTHQYRGIG